MDALKLAKSVKVLPPGNPKRKENLDSWHKGSHPETKTPDGTPRVFYHGTGGDFSVFNPQHRKDSVRSIFVSHTPDFADLFASDKDYKADDKPASIMPVHVSTKNPFDYENPEHVDMVLKELKKNKDFMEDYGNEFKDYAKGIAEGNWNAIEDPFVQDVIQNHHDGFFAQGNGNRFLSVYNPNQLKSATGNNGNFDPQNPDIRKAQGGSIHMIHGTHVGSNVRFTGAR